MHLFRLHRPALALALAPMAIAQIALNPLPTRVIGQDSTTISGYTPNLVEGREFDSPLGIALDLSSNPTHLYVADTGNNRVLGWSNAASFSNGQKADVVIGQPDFSTTFAQGPNQGQPPRQTGLYAPVGLAVDAAGNLYVADCGNNRVLRFPKPFSQSSAINPDLVLGQSDFTTNNPNRNGIGPATLLFDSGSSPLAAYLTFDGNGNLFVADPGNNRVLRFPASALNSAISGAAADLVIGQPDFVSNSLPGYSSSSLNLIASPTGVAFDSQGNLFVSESTGGSLGRVLIFPAPQTTGETANRELGVPSALPATAVNALQIGPGSGALITVNDQLLVADTYNNRILIFAPVSQWTSDLSSQPAIAVIGQSDLTSGSPNMGQPQASATSLHSVAAMAFSGAELFVADSANHRVLALPQSGSSFGGATRVLGQTDLTLNTVNLIEGREVNFATGSVGDAGIAIDYTSNPPHLYIADPYNNRVLAFANVHSVGAGSMADLVIGQPDFQHSLVNYPSNNPAAPNASGLNTPAGVAVDTNGNLYVADTGNARVLRFPSPFATSQNMPAADTVLGQSSFTIKITDPSATTMAAPYGLAFASDSGLLVSDLQHNRVLFFSGSAANFASGMAASQVFGQPDFTTISADSALDKLSFPHHIATDTSNRLYVADTGNARVSIFSDVTSAGADSQAAVTLTGLNGPRGVSVSSSTGEIWVANTNSAQALRFPKFDDLALQSYQANFVISESVAPISILQDAGGGALYVADAANRIAVFFPGLAGLNDANYLGPCVPNNTCDTNTARALSPNSIVALYSTSGQSNYFGIATASAPSLPLPPTLSDIQVLVNNVPAPLYYVSSSQINFYVPNDAPSSGNVNITVQHVSTGQVLGSTDFPMAETSPGLFTLSSDGTGQVAALNADGSLNGPDHPAPWNSYVSFYGTGAGAIPGAPSDGSAPSGPISTPETPQVIVGAGYVPAGNIQYSGLAPGLVGVWQVNVKIPNSVAPTTSTAPTPVILILNGTPSGGPVFGRATTMWVKPD